MWLQTSHLGVSAIKPALRFACARTEMAAAARLRADCNRSRDRHLSTSPQANPEPPNHPWWDFRDFQWVNDGPDAGGFS